MSDYPIQLSVSPPAQFERIQVLVRILVAIVLGWIGITAGRLVGLLYLALPVGVALALSAVGMLRYDNEVRPKIWRVLTWLLQLWAYMALLVDRLPSGGDHPVRLDARFTGRPTTGSALVRLLTSLPSGLVLMLLWVVSGVLSFVAAIVVLVSERVPPSILRFQRGVLRWNARLVAYHASFVDEYPPFSFDAGEGRDTFTASEAR